MKKSRSLLYIWAFLPLSLSASTFVLSDEVSRSSSSSGAPGPSITSFNESIGIMPAAVSLSGLAAGTSFSFTFSPETITGFEYFLRGTTQGLSLSLQTEGFSGADAFDVIDNPSLGFTVTIGSAPSLNETSGGLTFNTQGSDQFELSFLFEDLNDFSFTNFTISGDIQSSNLSDGTYSLSGGLRSDLTLFESNAENPGDFFSPIPEVRHFTLLLTLGLLACLLQKRAVGQTRTP